MGLYPSRSGVDGSGGSPSAVGAKSSLSVLIPTLKDCDHVLSEHLDDERTLDKNKSVIHGWSNKQDTTRLVRLVGGHNEDTEWDAGPPCPLLCLVLPLTRKLYLDRIPDMSSRFINMSSSQRMLLMRNHKYSRRYSTETGTEAKTASPQRQPGWVGANNTSLHPEPLPERPWGGKIRGLTTFTVLPGTSSFKIVGSEYQFNHSSYCIIPGVLRRLRRWRAHLFPCRFPCI
jgi:hypothetical protein